ncbi:MAG: lipoyl synthase [Deltaproteobacteria bacterium]|nr:lipoyl synthase [Deltaproteobacteria bacterium]
MPGRLPSWLRRKVGRGRDVSAVRKVLRSNGLHTVCEEAGCPNLGECFNHHVATFMILGDTCTRDCRFCGVRKGIPSAPRDDEPESVAKAVQALNLKHVVITSVTRDDLEDKGATWFARTIKAVRDRVPLVTIEILVPDFKGNPKALDTVLAQGPDVFNHNVETVPRLYGEVRHGAEYSRSLSLLADASAKKARTKSGLMLGLGETWSEVEQVMIDLRNSGVTMLTMGQYLKPNKRAYPVAEYLDPKVFKEYGRLAGNMGFENVFSGPLVRSSYHAAEQVRRDIKNA